MTKTDRITILEKAVELYAQLGAETFSTRRLAKTIPISHSVLYHYFPQEEILLKEMYTYANGRLGELRAALPQVKTSAELLTQRIEFQIDHAVYVVAVLKYFLMHRTDFEGHAKGFAPQKATLHIEEVLEHGVQTGEFSVRDIADDAKVITHAINGFLLEYYPHQPYGAEKEELISRIYSFLIRALTNGGETK